MTQMTRKRFLGSLTAISAAASVAPWRDAAFADESTGVPNDSTAIPPVTGKATQFSERVFDDCARMLCGALSFVGDRLGLFKSLSQLGECTPAKLAKSSKCNERLIVEWLKAMMAYGYVEYLPQSGRFCLSTEQAAVLADEESELFMGGMLQTTVPQVMVAYKVMTSFTSGRPMTPDVFHPDLWEGIDRSSASIYEHQLVDDWLALMPGVAKKLKTGAKAVDVGCGQGNAVIVLARRFPNSTFVGFDPYGPSIEKAKQASRRAGVFDRVRFIMGSAEDLPASQFDLATSLLTLHHMSHPVRDLAAIRDSLTPAGSYLIREDNLSNELQGHVTPLARLSYSASVLCCLHDSMANDGAALGPLTEVRVAQLTRKAGFSVCRKLPFKSSFDALYEAKK